MGGSALYIETQGIKRGLDEKGTQRGGGTLKATGNLKDVMKESAQIAYTVARARLADIDPTNEFFDKTDIHLHVPEGATPNYLAAPIIFEIGCAISNEKFRFAQVNIPQQSALLPSGMSNISCCFNFQPQHLSMRFRNQINYTQQSRENSLLRIKRSLRPERWKATVQ